MRSSQQLQPPTTPQINSKCYLLVSWLKQVFSRTDEKLSDALRAWPGVVEPPRHPEGSRYPNTALKEQMNHNPIPCLMIMPTWYRDIRPTKGHVVLRCSNGTIWGFCLAQPKTCQPNNGPVLAFGPLSTSFLESLQTHGRLHANWGAHTSNTTRTRSVRTPVKLETLLRGAWELGSSE